jgi:hypothetical protein
MDYADPRGKFQQIVKFLKGPVFPATHRNAAKRGDDMDSVPKNPSTSKEKTRLPRLAAG